MNKCYFEEETYPKKLKKIKNPPQKLYIEGNQDLLNSIGIAVIGSRHNSSYGKRMCKKFVQDLVNYNVTIISGLAQGIDSISHKTCLENGGKTIAVLPCGFENIYPKENEGLYKDIMNLGGCIVTEYDLEEEADSKKFLKRNRIVAGLAIGTLVIEAGYRSGTSVTARLTMEQGKKVFCVPSSLENDKGIMCNQIIQRGGKLVTCVEDILQEFKDIEFKKRITNEEREKRIEKEYLDVYKVLSNESLHINQIARITKLPLEEVNYKLMMLEIMGKVIQLPGKEFIKKG